MALENGGSAGNGVRATLRAHEQRLGRLEDQATRHERECLEERRAASRARETFRSEVSGNFERVYGKIEDLGEKLHERISKLAEASAARDQELQQQQASERELLWKRLFWASLALCSLLLGVVGYFVDKFGSWLLPAIGL